MIDELKGQLKGASIRNQSLDKRIQKLLVGHLLVTALVLAAASLLPQFGLLSFLTSGQVALFGVWAGLVSVNLWQKRLGAIAVGVAYGALFVSLQYFIRVLSSNMIGWDSVQVWDFLWNSLLGYLFNSAVFVSIQIVAITTALQLMQRVWKIHLHHYRAVAPAPTTEGVQFSIRHLIVLTATIGVVVVIGTYMRRTLPTEPTASNRVMLNWIVLCHLTIMTICSVLIALPAVWSTMTPARPRLRIVTAVVLSLFIGLVNPFVFSRPWDSYLISPLYTAGTMLVVIISLLFFRQCGYRLTREFPCHDDVAG